MSLKSILEEDWSDYDNLKIIDSRDARFFACTETWEVSYLIKKIKKYHPSFTEQEIKKAIQICCSELRPNYPRKAFVECVARRLGISTI